MILSSRPLRFLGTVIGGWIGVRALLLWPVSQVAPPLIQAIAPPALAEVASAAPPTRASAVPTSATGRIGRRTVLKFGRRLQSGATATRLPIAGSIEASAFAPAEAENLPGGTPPMPSLPAGTDRPPTFELSRWSGSAWAILRPDGRATPFASQLGGSQAGARIAYAVDGARRVAVYARASSAIDARQKEAAVGVDWRPTRAPVHLVAEQRIGIEGVRSGFAVGAVGGVGPTQLAGPVRVEGYAQAGVIFRDGREGYVDGSVRTTIAAGKRIDLGLGAWGGAQKGAARLDVGPTIGVTLPVERHALRLAIDWRQRVAGDARPGSGPALSLGTDF